MTNTGVAVQPRTIITVWPRLSQLWKHSHSEITGHVTLLKLSIYLHTCLPPVSAYGILLRSKHLHLIMFVPESIYCPLFGITLFILADLKQDFVVYFLHTLLLTFLILIDSTHHASHLARRPRPRPRSRRDAAMPTTWGRTTRATTPRAEYIT